MVNVVDVEDVACGHVLALERGAPGERYILGGENLSHHAWARGIVAAAERDGVALTRLPGRPHEELGAQLVLPGKIVVE